MRKTKSVSTTGKSKASKVRKSAQSVAPTEIPKKPKNFILCPTCNAKSKKLRSEMGGLQTRKCRNGHYFEVDMFFGVESNKRRVENIDRPLYVMGGSYSDYIYGKYKDDPKGKMDMLKNILANDRKRHMGG
jgi:ribosomal protein L37AE/L43A